MLSILTCAIEEKVIVWVQILMMNKKVVLLSPQEKKNFKYSWFCKESFVRFM